MPIHEVDMALPLEPCLRRRRKAGHGLARVAPLVCDSPRDDSRPFVPDAAEQFGHTDGGGLLSRLYFRPDNKRALDAIARAFEREASEPTHIEDARERSEQQKGPDMSFDRLEEARKLYDSTHPDYDSEVPDWKRRLDAGAESWEI